jgi:hypothetical protein
MLRNNGATGVLSDPDGKPGRARTKPEQRIGRADHVLLTEHGRQVAETVNVKSGE